MRVAFQIRAVIVNHEVFLNPSESPPTVGIKFLVLPCPTWILRIARGTGIKVPVVCCKGCFCPISLHQSASGCPIIRIPKAGINPHRLVLREWNTNWFSILEYSYRSVIHQETEKTKTKTKTNTLEKIKISENFKLKKKTKCKELLRVCFLIRVSCSLSRGFS